MRAVDIVIPIYNGYEETRRCIESALATTSNERLVLVNDSSPDPAITSMLREFDATRERVLLLENTENLGFVATANRGMEQGPDRDVLLLNSDVEVANDWLGRLREAAYSCSDVASVTPFANNATITSFPNFCEDNSLPFGMELAALDACFSRLPLESSLFEIPTGIGCCMYIRRDCLDVVGYFDVETFGRGYGEENDWCQRALAAGWRNFHLGNCFIYHKGGVSFAEEQSPRVARAMEILDERYPSYHGTIQQYIASDPARAARTEMLLRLFAEQDKVKVVSISHKLGGGAQQHVDELASHYADTALFLQLTPEQEGRSVTLSVFDNGRRLKDGLHFDIDREYDKLVQLLTGLGVGHVHFHHTMGVHPRLWLLAEALDCRHDLTIHDYYLVNGNPTMTDADARYVDMEAADFDRRCAEHYPLPEGVTAGDWRANQELLIRSARNVIFPSRECAQRFQRFFDVSHPVAAWHPDYQTSQPYPEPHWRYEGGRALRVLVLGAISREKGADVLEEVAGYFSSAEIEFHLLGYAYRAMASPVITHGPYDNSCVNELVQAIDPDVVWFPALWPETYSYTLSVALHLGLPVVVPDIGAFVERVAGRSHSAIRPWDSSNEAWAQFWQQVRESGELVPASEQGTSASGEVPPDFYSHLYLEGLVSRRGELTRAMLDTLADNYHAGVPTLSRRERLLGQIWRLARRPIVAKMVSLVPFRVQRALKRRLSSRPIHDIVR